MHKINQFSNQKIALSFLTESNQHSKPYLACSYSSTAWSLYHYTSRRYTQTLLVKGLNETVFPENVLANCIKSLKSVYFF